MTAVEQPAYPTYDTYDKAVAAQSRRRREFGIYSGIIRVGEKYALRCDVAWSTP